MSTSLGVLTLTLRFLKFHISQAFLEKNLNFHLKIVTYLTDFTAGGCHPATSCLVLISFHRCQHQNDRNISHTMVNNQSWPFRNSEHFGLGAPTLIGIYQATTHLGKIKGDTGSSV